MQELSTFISNHPALSLAFAIIFVLVVVIEFIRAKRNTFNLSPADVTQKINRDNAIVIDIRPKDAYRKGHIINAESMTSAEIATNSKKIEKLKAKTVIIVCPSGIESQKIAARLLKQGYNAYSLSGGIRAWIEAQMPLVKE